MMIRPEIKEAVFKKFMTRVNLKYSAAMYQWRYNYCENVNKAQLIDNLDTISHHFLKSVNISRKPLPDTIEEGKISFDFEKRYHTCINGKETINKRPWNIHSFWSLGMADPFPDESTMMDTDNQYVGPDKFNMSKLVYPKSRFTKEHTPMIIYIPSREMMIKIMRASMGCQRIEDLWFNMP